MDSKLTSLTLDLVSASMSPIFMPLTHQILSTILTVISDAYVLCRCFSCEVSQVHELFIQKEAYIKAETDTQFCIAAMWSIIR